MKEYSSQFKDLFQSYIRFREASGVWSEAYARNLRYFDRYCIERFPNATALTQEIIDGWAEKRGTETIASRDKRIYVVSGLVKYCNSRKLAELAVPQASKWEGRTYIPHAFTKEEMILFFQRCDTLEAFTDSRKTSRIRCLTIPVFFRLLYSSGIRTTEARMLRRKDVCMEGGVLNVVNTKGLNQHFVVMHDSMLELMRKYDYVMEGYIPQREYFFPSGRDTYYTTSWVDYNFRQIWYSFSKESATAYDLRHNYAIQNINAWKGLTAVDIHMQYLSRSMGHSDLESTSYYYSLVPAFSDLLKEASEDAFNEIVPEVVGYEE
jgi:integrase